MDHLLKTGLEDRFHIDMRGQHEVHWWMKHLGVTREELLAAVEKVGNSAAAVRKQLGHDRHVDAGQ
jgi:hypothetical protein